MTTARGSGLAGSVALVTGGGRGMGRAFAEALVDAGASVAVVGLGADDIDAAGRAVAARGVPALGLVADVAEPAQASDAVLRVVEQLGPIDLLVNNAGVFTPLAPLHEVDPDAWWATMAVNLGAAMRLSRAVLPSMRERRRGRIVNIASRAGLAAIEANSAYTVSKTALIRLTEQIAVENAEAGLAAFAIDPGPVRTAMSDWILESDEGRRWLPGFAQRIEAAAVPVERVVALVLALAGGRADALSGRVIGTADDLDALVAQAAAIRDSEQLLLRLRRPA